MMEEKDRPLMIYVISILGVMFCILGLYLIIGGGKADKSNDKGNSVAKNDTGYSTNTEGQVKPEQKKELRKLQLGKRLKKKPTK